MADESPLADDCVDSGRRRRLAGIRSFKRRSPDVPPNCHSLDNPRNTSSDPCTLLPSVNWMGGVQVVCDIILITGLVYATGLQDSYFTSLYMLIIIVASILFSRRGAFLPLFCLFSLGLITLLAYRGHIPRTSLAVPTTENLRMWFLSNSFGFLAVAYLASLLAQSFGIRVRNLKRKGRMMELQDFTADIIHSMRGGSGHDRSGWPYRSSQPYRGRNPGPLFAELRGRDIRSVNPQFWLTDMSALPTRLSMRRELK